eukprot:TRINITY_DN10881_c0_g1_i4.p1 TRINITY_DN10881_c0_g1~~TRINITY_DN10881_c0_g1_i4.p1  ORF type:complete len:141 (+),score=15.84 TRINITY_DN10881_c0_g1_i4:100-522(+)
MENQVSLQKLLASLNEDARLHAREIERLIINKDVKALENFPEFLPEDFEMVSKYLEFQNSQRESLATPQSIHLNFLSNAVQGPHYLEMGSQTSRSQVPKNNNSLIQVSNSADKQLSWFKVEKLFNYASFIKVEDLSLIHI